MIFVRRALAAIALATLFAAPVPLRAADVSALSGGVRASGTMVVQTTISGTPITVGGDIALFHRGNFYRLDLLSLAFPGPSSPLSTMAGALLPQGGATVIYNGVTGAISAYSNANHSFYSAEPAAPPPRNPAPANGPPPVAADPLDALAGIARQLRDMQSASLQFTGHGTTNGHPVSNIDVQLKRQLPGKSPENYHAQLALADDLDGFPVQLLVSVTPPNPGDFGGNARLDLVNVIPEAQADAVFAIPGGYTRVTNIGDVLRPPAR
jgi:hypothetical protein